MITIQENIDVIIGSTQGAVYDDLTQIALCDPGLGTSEIFGYGLLVQYQPSDQQTPLRPSQTRLNNIANQQGVLVVITGVGPDFQLPNGSPFFGGDTIIPAASADTVYIYYDVTDRPANESYVVTGRSGELLYAPRCTILYHELAHAYQWILATQGNVYPDDTTRQVQAISDENEFRGELGLAAREPGTNVQVGTPYHGTAWNKCPNSDTNWKCQGVVTCVVATAAVGSANDPLVVRLEHARSNYLTLSSWTGQVVAQAVALYQQFGPVVVRDMSSDPDLCSAMLVYAVLPVVRFIDVIELYIAEPASGDLLLRLDKCVETYASEAASGKASATTLRAAAEAATDAGRKLARGFESEPDHSTRQMPEGLFTYLASTIASIGSDTKSFAWGFEGLAILLKSAAAKLADGTRIDQSFVTELDEWLARLPIPADAELSITTAPDELRALGERFFTSADTRQLFATFLLARWPNDSALALGSLLGSLNYIAQTR